MNNILDESFRKNNYFNFHLNLYWKAFSSGNNFSYTILNENELPTCPIYIIYFPV